MVEISQLDLFASTQRATGNTNPPSRAKRKPTQARGYAFHPGTGPAGETCGSCEHIVRGRRYRKCALNRAKWTHGPATEVKARAPACKKWEAAAP